MANEALAVECLHPETLNPGETVIVLQRNAKDNRDPESDTDLGALDERSAETTKEKVRGFFDELFDSLDPADWGSVDILVYASDAELITPRPEIRSPHKRALETAEIDIETIEELLAKRGLSRTQLLNESGPIPVTNQQLDDLRMLRDSPGFVDFIRGIYGTGKNFWVNYENDSSRHRYIREQMGAEGPEDIADRVEEFIATLSSEMNAYHQSHPGRRVVIFAVSHYDAISPYAKLNVAKLPTTKYLGVGYGDGLVIKINSDGTGETRIGDKSFPVTLGV